MIPALLSIRTNQNPTGMPLRIGKHRLFRLLLPLVAVILFQAFLPGLSLEVLSSVRAYVGGESLWSKGQKDAIHFLTLYSQTGEGQYLDKFRSAGAVPLAGCAAPKSRPPKR